MIIKKIVNGKLSTNTYLIYDDEKNAAIIDPAEDTERMISEIKDLGLNLKYIINTHCHPDHISGNKKIYEEFSCELLAHKKEEHMLDDSTSHLAKYLGIEKDQPKIDKYIKDGDIIQVGSIQLRVIETPGHTEGSVSLHDENKKVLFSGDTLFHRSVGRTDLPGGDVYVLLESLAKLLNLPEDVRVLPGHSGETTIAFEKENNPFAKRLG
jgi:glyoxylase-like metal-dependent hydrolase (beta-lactamase superfamily II)